MLKGRITRRRLLRDGAKTALALTTAGALGVDATAFVSGGATAQTAARGRASGLRRAFALLDAFVARQMREAGAPGMTLALADRAGAVRTSAYGFADVKAREPVRTQTLFQIGSVSKSFAAIAALQLREEGKLDLERPVSEYLPWLEVESPFAPLNTHHLLSHTSGLPGGISFVLRTPSGKLWTGAAPGERFVYSNPGYEILGLLLEALDKRPLSEVLRERVFKPLGMTASEPVITNRVRPRLAVGYAPLHDDRPFPRGGPLAEAPWIEMGNAAGSIASNAPDMAAYLSMLLNRGAGPRSRVLSEEGFKLFTRPVIRAPFRGEEASYAYGLWVNERDGHTHLRHTGGMVAFSSAMHVDLTDGLGAFASVNANLVGYRPVAVAKYALEVLGAALAGRTLPEAPPPAPPATEVDNAADYAGTYAAPDGRKLVFVAEGKQLLLAQEGRRVALERSGGRDSFIVKHPRFERFRLAFGREGGRVVEAAHGADWYAHAERYAGPRAFTHPPEWEAYAGHYRSDSPWFGSARVVLRKGRLWLDGEAPLTPAAQPGTFRLGEDASSPDRVSFELLMGGRPMLLNVSGVDFYRTFTP